jgi:hypothetical protein
VGQAEAAAWSVDGEVKLMPVDIEHEMKEAEEKAWDSLARYKFQMFGYWAAIWVHLNKIGGFKKPNPFKPLVVEARKEAFL